MVKFWVYDVTFLAVFSIWVFWFLKNHKKNLKCEARFLGIPFYMYRTQAGVNFINWTGDNCKKFLHSMKYLIIATGYILMGIIIWMLGRFFYNYLFTPELTEMIKAPPIAPVIPYFPKLFGMESFFPPFYFTYFLVALAIVMIVHEFSHGIFMRLFKIKIKSTGLVFFGPILGAFVEQDDKSFDKKPKTEQMTVLAAGVFANVITALAFLGVYLAMFSLLFVPAGFQFNSYAAIPNVPVSLIDEIGESAGEFNLLYGGASGVLNLSFVTINGTKYLTTSKIHELRDDSNYNFSTTLFLDSPALRTQMAGAIIEADGVKIKNQEDLSNFMKTKNPGDTVKFKTIQKDKSVIEYEITLEKNPLNDSISYLGIGFNERAPNSKIQYLTYRFMTNVGSTSIFSEPSTYYRPIIAKDFVEFIYIMFWWVVLINFLVAIMNMIPAGIFDGGKFFYLTILGITKSKRAAEGFFKFATYTVLAILIITMVYWAIRVLPSILGF